MALAYQNVSTQRSNGKVETTAISAADAPPAALKNRLENRLRSFNLSENVVFLILLGLVALGMFGTENFLSLPNMSNLLRQMVIPMLLGIGQTLVILSGGIDLSVSAVVTLANVYAAGLMMGMNERLLPVALLCLGVGLLIGLINAFVVIKLRVVPIIATMGMMVIGRGLALIIRQLGVPIHAPIRPLAQ